MSSELSGPPATAGAADDEFGWPDFDDSDTVAVPDVSSTPGPARPARTEAADVEHESTEDDRPARQPGESARSHQPAAGR